MDEDKIASDISDKRKLEEDSVNPKPNPKRIKLVRPVFSLVAKPTISSSTETIKSDVQPTEIPKCSSSTEKVLSVVDVSQRAEKSFDAPETIKKSIDQVETVCKPVTTLPVFDEQVDSSSDALDISNTFSEETKKELEHLKKHIFKIDDDGSSSENDSQPKRPRLKRPTFFTSAAESKVESNDANILEKVNETPTNLEKSECEENINNIDKCIVKELTVENMADKLTENLSENLKNDNEEQDSIVTESIIENKSINNEKFEEASNEKSIVTENINKVIEKKSDAPNSINEMIKNKINQTKCVNTILEENTTVVETLCEIAKTVVESINDDTVIMPNAIKTNPIVQEEKENTLIKEKCIINDEVKQKAEEPDLKKEKVAEDNTTTIKEHNNEIDFIKKNVFESTKVVLDVFNENKDVNPISATRLVNENDIKIAAETINEELIEECNVKYTKNVEDKIKDTPTNETIITIKNDVAEEISNENPQVVNENKSSLKQALNIEQNQEEHGSQSFKSDILKAALMSRKSSELLVNSPKVHESGTNIDSSPVETIKIDILPNKGQEAIVNKIETEIKLIINDELSSNKKLQNKSHINVTEINIPKEASNTNCLSENIMSSTHDEPPKWGSAKMNEVEKFLNDSNVTITPICKPQESPKLGKITLKLPKVGNPEIKCETTVRPDVKSELIKKITNKQIAMGESPLKNALSQPTKSFSDFAIIRPAPKLSAEQIAQIEQQILNTPKKRGRPSKALAQQKQLLLQYQQQQQQQQQLHKIQEGSTEDESVFHVPLFDMDDMSVGGANMFDSFEASTPKLDKSVRGKGSRGRRGRGGGGGRVRGRDGSDSDTTSISRRVEEEGETFPEEMSRDEETKQVALIEAERLRKEEERERKMEARKKKLKERNDALKEKKMKKKQKAEERRLQWHEKKRLMQEEKARAAEMKKSLPPPQNFDDETRMSADCNNSRSQTPARNFMLGEDDLSFSGSMNDSLRMKKGRMEVIDHESNKTLTVDQIAEYQWPLEGGELYMIQEQISNFLGVKSFKRKYPGLKRRNVEAEERTFLCDSGLVAESLCDLGLTVLYSSEVLDVMYADFPEKYEELREYMRLKHAKELSNRQKALITISSNADGSKLDVRDRAMESAANWNVNFNKSRLESRKCSMDMQSFIVHYPKNKCKKMAIPKLKIGSYPLALLPGQFCDYYATYSSEDLRYLPMNTVMYGPLKSIDKDFPVSLSSQSESEDSSSDDSSDSDDSIEVDNKSVKNGLENSPSDKKGAECKLCLGTAEKNKNGTVEPLIHCSKCSTIYHPTCLDMTLEMIPHIKRYNWQCNECKSCVQCKEIADEDKMLFCDLCDRGYHIYCVGLRKVPEGRWHCQECAMCSSCGVSDPGPGDSKWFYEFKKIEKTGSKVYRRTLCAPCSRLWKKGHYCPNCMRCYPIKNVERMTQCNSCDRYLHPECVCENTPNNQVVTCNICEEKAVSRLLTTVPRSLIKV